MLVIVVVSFSRFTWVRFLAIKGENVEKITALLEIGFQLNSVLLACILVVLDSTMTLNFNMLHYCCEEFGVHHEFSTSITPKQHRFVKRINYVLVDLGRVMLKCL